MSLFPDIKGKVDELLEFGAVLKNPILKKLLEHPFMKMLLSVQSKQRNDLFTIYGGFLRQLVKNMSFPINTQEKVMSDYLKKSDVDIRVLKDFSNLGFWTTTRLTSITTSTVEFFIKKLDQIGAKYPNIQKSSLQGLIQAYLANRITPPHPDKDSGSVLDEVFWNYFHYDVNFCLWYLGVHSFDNGINLPSYRGRRSVDNNDAFVPKRMIINLKMDDDQVIKFDFTTCQSIYDDKYDLTTNILGLRFFPLISPDSNVNNFPGGDGRDCMVMSVLDDKYTLWEVVSDIVTNQFTIIDTAGGTKMLWRILKMMEAGYTPKINQSDILIGYLGDVRFNITDGVFPSHYTDEEKGLQRLYMMAVNYLISIGGEAAIDTLKKATDNFFDGDSIFLVNVVYAHLLEKKSPMLFMKTWCKGLTSQKVEQYLVNEDSILDIQDYHEICNFTQLKEKVVAASQKLPKMSIKQMKKAIYSFSSKIPENLDEMKLVISFNTQFITMLETASSIEMKNYINLKYSY
ncbi:MAG: hypothetical protein WD512_13385 [Candidatus Paceibacterota bacterium]